jgi:hypothetical protein
MVMTMAKKIALILALCSSVAWAAPKKKGKKPNTTPPATSPTPPPTPPSVPPPPATAPAPETPEATPAVPPPTPAPAPTPAPPPPPPPTLPPPSKGNAELDALNAEYNTLRDELFRSRAKVEMLGAALYKTKLVATLKYQAQRTWPVKKLWLKLDEAPVFAADTPNAGDPIKLFEGFTTPGRHTLTIRVECGAVGESRLGYSAEDSFTFDVDDNHQTTVDFSVDEDGEGPQKLAKKKSGTIDVRVFADVKSEPIKEKK